MSGCSRHNFFITHESRNDEPHTYQRGPPYGVKPTTATNLWSSASSQWKRGRDAHPLQHHSASMREDEGDDEVVVQNFINHGICKRFPTLAPPK